MGKELGKGSSKEKESLGVLCHNDTKYGNLLRLKKNPQRATRPPSGTSLTLLLILFRPLFQIIVVDFEYASPDAVAFDITNHFHEWTANYHGDTPALLN